MAKLSGVRLPGFVGPGSGDYQPSYNFNPVARPQQKPFRFTSWDDIPHPSRDMCGIVNASKYYARRQLMGRNHPAFAFLCVARSPSGTNKQKI